MARIRTIKPEFFTSEDIVLLSPIARLLYVGLWCEADREGRLVWKPGTLKLRYLPSDQDDFQAASSELIDRGLLVLYGASYAHIPTFLNHQRPNPREAKSIIPTPEPVDSSSGSARVYPQFHDANLDLHVQGGREGKEGKGREVPEATESPTTSTPPLNPGWWRSDAGIDEAGKQLEMPPQRGENYQQYKQRLFDHINRNKAEKAA